jgi:4-hydroxy-tetrahydrodipicolinate synthase
MFEGSFVALVTPMHADGRMDKKSLGELIEWHISEGTDGIVVNGTTGESPTLAHSEQKELIDFVIKTVKGRILVIAGTGSNSTAKTIADTQEAFSLGADACLLIAPYYNRPPQEGLYQHYKAVAEAVSGPLILYNQPTRTGIDILPETVARLAVLPNIVAIKDIVSIERFSSLLNNKDLSVLTGEDSLTFELLKIGGQGVISVTANIAPGKMAAMCRAAHAGDWEKAEALSKELDILHDVLFVESNPIPVKWALQQMGKIESGIRLPLVGLSEANQEKVLTALKQTKLVN